MKSKFAVGQKVNYYAEAYEITESKRVGHSIKHLIVNLYPRYKKRVVSEEELIRHNPHNTGL